MLSVLRDVSVWISIQLTSTHKICSAMNANFVACTCVIKARLFTRLAHARREPTRLQKIRSKRTHIAHLCSGDR
jgi:hypothetical protein